MAVTRKPELPASARTLRRTERRLATQSSALFSAVTAMRSEILDVVHHKFNLFDIYGVRGQLEQLADRFAELGERQRVIEGDIEKIQRNVGVLAKHSQVPRLPLAQVHPLRRV